MKARRRLILLLLFLVVMATLTSPLPVQGAEKSPMGQSTENLSTGIEINPEQIKFERVPLPSGLASKIIQSIAQDHQGFIWIGTEGGLYKYDGYEFTLFQREEDATISFGNDIEVLFVDSQNKIWVGTPEGLFRFDKATNSLERFHDKYIFSIYEDRKGVLWISALDDVYQFDAEKNELTRWAFANFGPVITFHESRDGAMWLGTTVGLFRYQVDKSVGDNLKQYQHSAQDFNSISDDLIVSIVEDQNNNLWVGTANNGINRLSLEDQDQGVFTHFTNTPDSAHYLNNNVVTSSVIDQSGNLWVGTTNGLNLYDPDQESFIHFDSGEFELFFSGFIMSLFVDQSGLLWVGSIGALDKLDLTAHRFIPFANPAIKDQIILSGYEEQNGTNWFGTFQDGLYLFSADSTMIHHYRHDPEDPKSLSHNSVRVIFRDSLDILWVGTESGLNTFDSQTETFTQDPRLVGFQITSIFEDPTGRLWIGTSNGLFNSLRSIRSFSRLRDGYITDIEAAEDGNVWIGTVNGLHLINPEGQSIAHYTFETPESLANDWINDIYKEQNGILWIGTGDGGIDRFDPTTEIFTHYTKDDGLISDTVYCILGDDKDNLWVGTDHGVSKFEQATGDFYNYDMKDGLSGNEVLGCFRTQHGMIAFAGLRGLNYLGAEEIQNNLHSPPVVITAFKKFNQTVKMDLAPEETIQLSHNDNFISFEFAALDYVHPEKNQYAYKMEGLDEDWVFEKNRGFADYPDLKPGEYVFRVIGSNNDGIWNEAGTSVHVRVTPAIWQTWWFWSLIGFALVGVVYGAYRLRVRNLQNRSRELEAQVASRTREINQRRQEIEALYRADEELHRHLEFDQVLQALVETAIEILQADKGTLLVWDDAREHLIVRASRGFLAETLQRISFEPGEGIAGLVGTTGEPIIVEDTQVDPRVTQEIVMAEGIRSFMQVPITIEEEIFGVFSADFTQSHTFSQDEQRLLISLAQRAALAIENARLYEQAQELGILQERNRLARDLHDSVTQSMYSVTMYADAANTQLSTQQISAAAENLDKLREIIKEATRDLRLLIFELRPQILQEEGLAAAIEARLDAVENRAGIQIDFATSGESKLPFYIEDGLYRITLEALTNALKHAQADQIQIRLQFEQKSATMEIQDNGIGYDPATAQESGGLGIHGMKERAAEIGAKLKVESEPGKGTLVTIHVKVKDGTI